jgi:DNA-binding PadR family transcriptional regulator
MAMVPKGFLRYQVLKLLNEKPMSGSELMSEIEKQTEGQWKPSPGSIYPLLAWLQDKGYIKEADGQEAGVKRYTLTDQGKAFLQEHVEKREELRKRFRHFGPPGPGSMGPMWFEFRSEEGRELLASARDMAIALWSFHDKLRRQHSEKALKDVQKVLEEATKKIEEITKQLHKDKE